MLVLDGDETLADGHDASCMRRQRGCVAIEPKPLDAGSPRSGFSALLRRTNRLCLAQSHADAHAAHEGRVIAGNDDVDATSFLDHNQRKQIAHLADSGSDDGTPQQG
jgi:hypothetical protein